MPTRALSYRLSELLEMAKKAAAEELDTPERKFHYTASASVSKAGNDPRESDEVTITVTQGALLSSPSQRRTAIDKD